MKVKILIKSLFNHLMEKYIVLSFNSTHLGCVRSLYIKRTVSSVSDRVDVLWVFRCCMKTFILLEFLYERVGTALWLFRKTVSLEITTKFWFIRSGPMLSLRSLWLIFAFCISLDVLVLNPLICSSFLEKRTNLRLHVWNTGCLPGVIVVKKVISSHKLYFIKLLISKWKPTQIDSFENWRLENFTFAPLNVEIYFLFPL